MKILIIGSEGFVGKNLVKGLSEKHDIYTSDQIDSANQNYSKCDITNYDSVAKKDPVYLTVEPIKNEID